MRGIDEIISSFGIDQLQSTPAGFKGCCDINPNHHDSKPSMHIHLERGLVKCFSCDAFMPLFDYLIHKNVPFDEAIDFFFTDFDPKTRVQKEGLSEYFLGRKIPKSMLDRGFTVGTLKHFNVGYDEHEHRITIPLRYKKVLYGIQYRAKPKRFWASDGFVKDKYIYNFEATDDRFYVEGFTDTWRAWQNGTKNVSATLSANPSVGQLELMSQHKRIFIAYDMDKAGFRGAFTIHKELKGSCEIFMVPYSNSDPGECSKEEWQEGLNRISTFTEFEVQMILKNRSLYEEITSKKKRI